jgi:hypothetical protein
VSTEETGFAPEPYLDLGPGPQGVPGQPPWLDGVSGHERIRAIVWAVAACYGSQREDVPSGAQHMTASVAGEFLERMLADSRAAGDVVAGLPARWKAGAAESARCAVTGARAEARTLAGCAEELETALRGIPAVAEEKPQPVPPLPPGTYGYVELPGMINDEGWISEGMLAGTPVLVVRARDGRVKARVNPQQMRRMAELPVPADSAQVPAAGPFAPALPAGGSCGCGPYEECDECAGPF